jgi:hypothetical protein
MSSRGEVNLGRMKASEWEGKGKLTTKAKA